MRMNNILLASAMMMTTFVGNIQATTDPAAAIRAVMGAELEKQKMQLTEEFAKKEADFAQQLAEARASAVITLDLSQLPQLEATLSVILPVFEQSSGSETAGNVHTAEAIRSGKFDRTAIVSLLTYIGTTLIQTKS